MMQRYRFLRIFTISIVHTFKDNVHNTKKSVMSVQERQKGAHDILR